MVDKMAAATWQGPDRGGTVCLVRRSPVESLSQKATRLLYRLFPPAQWGTAFSAKPRGLLSLIGHLAFLYCTGCCNLCRCGFCVFCKTLRPLLIDWPLARYSTRVASCSCRVASCSCCSWASCRFCVFCKTLDLFSLIGH